MPLYDQDTGVLTRQAYADYRPELPRHHLARKMQDRHYARAYSHGRPQRRRVFLRPYSESNLMLINTNRKHEPFWKSGTPSRRRLDAGGREHFLTGIYFELEFVATAR